MPNYRARGVTADGKPIFSEAIEQERVAAWLDAHGVFWFHPANEVPPMMGPRNIHMAWLQRQKRQGVKAGVPDIIILDAPTVLTGFIGAAVELKALDGAEPTKAQLDYLDAMSKRGFATGWFRGADAMIEWLTTLGYGR